MTLLRTQLGNTLRGHRLRQRRTLRDVSGAARVSLGYLSEVERGQKEASSELLASICDALDVELADLLAEVSLEMRLAEPGRRTVRPVALAGVGAATSRCPRRRPGCGRRRRGCRPSRRRRDPGRRARAGAGRRRGEPARASARTAPCPWPPDSHVRRPEPAPPVRSRLVGRALRRAGQVMRHEHRSVSTCLDPVRPAGHKVSMSSPGSRTSADAAAPRCRPPTAGRRGGRRPGGRRSRGGRRRGGRQAGHHLTTPVPIGVFPAARAGPAPHRAGALAAVAVPAPRPTTPHRDPRRPVGRPGVAMSRTRRGLLTGARTAFAERGLKKTTMQHVAAAAGVAKADAVQPLPHQGRRRAGARRLRARPARRPRRRAPADGRGAGAGRGGRRPPGAPPAGRDRAGDAGADDGPGRRALGRRRPHPGLRAADQPPRGRAGLPLAAGPGAAAGHRARAGRPGRRRHRAARRPTVPPVLTAARHHLGGPGRPLVCPGPHPVGRGDRGATPRAASAPTGPGATTSGAPDAVPLPPPAAEAAGLLSLPWDQPLEEWDPATSCSRCRSGASPGTSCASPPPTGTGVRAQGDRRAAGPARVRAAGGVRGGGPADRLGAGHLRRPARRPGRDPGDPLPRVLDVLPLRVLQPAGRRTRPTGCWTRSSSCWSGCTWPASSGATARCPTRCSGWTPARSPPTWSTPRPPSATRPCRRAARLRRRPGPRAGRRGADGPAGRRAAARRTSTRSRSPTAWPAGTRRCGTR